MPRRLLILLTVCLLGLPASLWAQVCNGNLGDPVAAVTFGEGSVVYPFGPRIVPATYTFVSADCPNDGQYSLRSRTANCYSQSWHTFNDHTPNDIDGHFMLVNSALNSGVFFTDTLKGLCPNVVYEFSIWIMNVLKPGNCSGSSILPDLTIRLETGAGVALATYNAGTIPELDRAAWRQYSFPFAIPAGANSVVMRIVNNAKGGCGNEFALDDIAIRPCGSLLTASIAANNEQTISICDGDNTPVRLNSTFTGIFINPAYQWQESIDNGRTWTDIAGATARTYMRPATAAGQFQYRTTIGEANNAGQCLISSNPIFITVTNKPNADITNYVYGCYGSTVILFASGGSTYNWTGPNGFTANVQQPNIPNVKFTDAGKYKVLVTDHLGCTSADSMILDIYPAANATKGPDVSFCEGDSAIITAGGGVRYQWIPATGLSRMDIAAPFAKPKQTTLYKAVVFSEYGCTDTAEINVVVWNKPVANAGPDKRMRQGYTVSLEGNIKGQDYTYNWTPSFFMDNPSSLQPKINPPGDMEYELRAVSTKGCGFTTDRVKVKVYDKVIVPNAFSPNGDGVNDTWIIEPLDLFDGAEVFVYDRYGRVAFHNKGYLKPWDGKRNGVPLPIGTYYYSIDLKVNKEPKIIGSLTIVR